ncbi:MAG: hypothetical protein ABFC62_08290 [Clostridiaceae bacterium]
MKRFSAVLLSLVMLFASLPAYAEGEEQFHVTTEIAGEGGVASPTDIYVERGGDVEFTIIPDEGYILDELFWDNGWESNPPIIGGVYTFFKEDVQRDTVLSISFMQFDTYDIFIESPVNGSLRLEGEDGPFPAGGIAVQRITRETVRLFVMPDEGYSVAGVYMTDTEGNEEDISWALGYDEEEGQLLLDYEPMYSGTLHFAFEEAPAAVYEDVAILSGEAGDDAQIKAAIRRESGLRLMPVAEAEITDISPAQGHTSSNGVSYGVIGAKIGGQPISIYVVESVTDLIFKLGLDDGEHIYITEESDTFAQDVLFEIAAFAEGDFEFYGPYDARLMTISDDILDCFLPVEGFRYKQRVVSPFYRAQFHVVNRGQGEKTLNWFPFTLVQENALCFNVMAVEQEAPAWSLDTYPHVTEGGGVQEIFFGNSTLTLVPPAGGAGNVSGMTAVAPASRGYSVTNNEDGTVTIDFLSDFYDEIVVKLTIGLESGGTVQRTLMLRRVGVDIQAHDFKDGDSSQTRTIFHGTQFGSRVSASGGSYKITASYFIPDFGSELPYGLYVTRRYANGRIETETVTQPLNDPHPGSADFSDGVFFYNNGESGMANAVDYLIYTGASKAEAPVEVSVLVLKNAPDGNAFGGVDFGSGAGVKWTRR